MLINRGFFINDKISLINHTEGAGGVVQSCCVLVTACFHRTSSTIPRLDDRQMHTPHWHTVSAEPVLANVSWNLGEMSHVCFMMMPWYCKTRVGALCSVKTKTKKPLCSTFVLCSWNAFIRCLHPRIVRPFLPHKISTNTTNCPQWKGVHNKKYTQPSPSGQHQWLPLDVSAVLSHCLAYYL